MKSLNVIPLLDSIPKVSSFSNYGLNLEKLFRMNSLKNLIKHLKYKKDYHNQITHEFSNVKNSSEEYDVFDRQQQQKLSEEEDDIDIFSLPISKSEAKIKKNQIKKYFFRKKKPDVSDTSSLAYKYNPNFNSIYKNIPTVKIFKQNLNDSKNKKSNLFNTDIKNNFSGYKSTKNIKETKNNNKENKKIINIINLNKNKYLNIINNYNKFKYQKNIQNKKIKHRNNSQSINTDNNSKNIKNIEAIKRFKTEMSLNQQKKFNNKKNSNNKLPSLSNQKGEKGEEKNTSINSIENTKNNFTPFHHKNRAVDFTKMRSRKSLIFKKTFQMPDPGCYEPKYNLVEKRQYDIFFNKKPDTDKHRRKKILLKKILTSYDIEPDYQTIDNKKLNNEIFQKYRFL